MFIRQKGIFPLLSTICGLLMVYPIFAVLLETLPRIFSSKNFLGLVLNIYIAVLLLLLPVVGGMIILRLFPRIRIMDSGLKFHDFPITTRFFSWEEIESVQSFKNGYGAIILRARGQMFRKGLWFSKLYGMMMGIIDPIIFISPNIMNLLELKEKLNANGIKIY